MNAVTHTEAQALHTVTPALPSQDMRLVPLTQLRPSRRNVRKTAGPSVDALAASIARVGLLQNLTVILAVDGEHYEVVAGGRRLAALQLLPKKHRIATYWPVPCLLVAEGNGAEDPLARVVGLDAYAAAGGGIRRDLFAEDDAGVYLEDAALLERLAQDKLAGIAMEVKAEGWAWVDATPAMTHADLQAFQRAPRERREPTKREAQRIEKLQARMQAIGEAVDAAMEEDDEDKAEALQEEGERLGEQLQALEDGLLHYSPSVKEASGAIVTVDRNGEAVIHRGLLREAEAKALRTLEKLRQGFSGGDAANDDEGEEGEAPKAAAISDRLAQRLSAHRTAALQIEVARHPQVALAALVHGMVQTVLQGRYCGPSNGSMPLGVRLTVQDRLEGMAPDWPESPAAVTLRELQEAWGGRLPEDSAELFTALLAMEQGELVQLLAVCVASTVDVVTPRTTLHQPGAELAEAVGLDMAAWWNPTTEGYFKHVSKAAVLQAVGEFAPESVHRLAKLKKAEIASEAERLAEGTGWMPAVFKAAGPQEVTQERGASGDAEAMADEPAESLAA